MFLVVDVGGTKTLLALYNQEQQLVFSHYRSDDNTFFSFYDLLEHFLSDHKIDRALITKISLAVAGPVVDDAANITNLKWRIEKPRLAEIFINAEQIIFVNDLFAMAHAVLHLKEDEYVTLHSFSHHLNGNKIVVAPGTGLGMAFLVFDGTKYIVGASQGGHVDFAPTTHQQVELLHFLQQNYHQVSSEMLCSGIGIANIFNFFQHKVGLIPDDEVQKDLANSTCIARTIVFHALKENPCACCTQTVELFLEILSRVVSNFAVKIIAVGGIYLAGGVMFGLEEYFVAHPNVLKKFVENVQRSTSMADILHAMPIYFIKNRHVVLKGARELLS